MLTQEVPRREVISDIHFKTLKDFMHAMRLYLPLSAPVRRFFYRIDEWLQPIQNQITATEWLNKVEEIQVRDLIEPSYFKSELCLGDIGHIEIDILIFMCLV